jgi:hypothetical protein
MMMDELPFLLYRSMMRRNTMATKTINLDDPDIFSVELTVSEARGLLDQLDNIEDVDAALISELDKAQGDVHSGKKKMAYLVIEISP